MRKKIVDFKEFLMKKGRLRREKEGDNAAAPSRIHLTIDDKIVQDSLESIRKFQNDKRYKTAIIGGMAIQLYLKEFRRPTNDLDVSIIPRINKTSFKTYVGPRIGGEITRESKRKTEVNVLRHSYEINVDDFFFIHMYRYSEKGWEKHKEREERIISDAEIIDGLRVVRPEEIIASKIERLRKMSSQGRLMQEIKSLTERIRNMEWDFLPPYRLGEIISMKEELPIHYDRGIHVFRLSLDLYRAAKDIYDLHFLIENIKDNKITFEERYFKEIIRKYKKSI